MYSMTGFASLNKKIGNNLFALKIMSVNSKFLEIKIEGTKNLELQEIAKNILQTEISRGKIHLEIKHEMARKEGGEFKIDEKVLTVYQKEFERVAKKLKIKNDITLRDLFKISETYLLKTTHDSEKENIDEKIFTELLQELLKKFKENRQKEGNKLKTKFKSYIKKLKTNAAALKKLKKENENLIKEKISKRLAEAYDTEISEIEAEARAKIIEKEINFSILKGDFEEELARVETHLEQFSKILESNESVGKKMGFLAQELLREFNTLGDKISLIQGKQVSIESKIIVDKIREQALNIE